MRALTIDHEMVKPGTYWPHEHRFSLLDLSFGQMTVLRDALETAVDAYDNRPQDFDHEGHERGSADMLRRLIAQAIEAHRFDTVKP